MRKIIAQAMRDPDRWVLSLDYQDREGTLTGRSVSPIRFLGQDRFLALCLCRQEPRQFYVARCHNVQLRDAHDVLMPEPFRKPSA